MNGFYWIYLVMLAATLGCEFAKEREQKRLIYYGACGFLILIFVAQGITPYTDIVEYMRQYHIIPTLSFGEMLTHKFEIGYVLLCRVIDAFFGSDRMLLVAVSLLIMIPFCRSFEKETEAPMVSLMAFLALGLYSHALGFWRQYCAMAILSCSYPFIRERKLLPFALTMLLAMSFHKSAAAFAVLYFLSRLPVNKRLLLLCAVGSALLGLFGRQIITLGIALIYPRYENVPWEPGSGYNMFAVLWIVTLLAYWVLGRRMSEDKIRIPFLMLLTGAAIQPIAFVYGDWSRIVMYFRVAMVPLCAEMYVTLFCRKENNPLLALLQRRMPKLHAAVLTLYDANWLRAAALIGMFAVLFFWYLSDLEGAVYILAPIT